MWRRPPDNLQTIGGDEIPFHDPMPSHTQPRPDGQLVLDQVCRPDLRPGVGSVCGVAGLAGCALEPILRRSNIALGLGA